MPQHAQRMSGLKRFRPKQRKIDANPALGEAIWQMLGQRMSPEQIAGRLRKLHPDDQTMWVCTETIYQSLFVQAKGELKQHIKACLQQGRAVRKPHRPKQSRQRFHDPMVMISDRPATVARGFTTFSARLSLVNRDLPGRDVGSVRLKDRDRDLVDVHTGPRTRSAHPLHTASVEGWPRPQRKHLGSTSS